MVLDEVAGFMEGNGFGIEGTSLFYPEFAPEPHIQYVIELSGGLPTDHAGGETVVVDTYGLRIKVRGEPNKQRFPLQQALALHALFDKTVNVDLSGAWYQDLAPIQPPFRILVDANNRAVFGFNVLARRERTI